MSSVIGIQTVKKNISEIFERRIAALYALCLYFAAKALQEFIYLQTSNNFWINRTGQAKDRVFADAFRESDSVVGWFLAHGVQYGVYIELANDRKHEALRPTVERLLPEFLESVKKIFEGIND